MGTIPREHLSYSGRSKWTPRGSNIQAEISRMNKESKRKEGRGSMILGKGKCMHRVQNTMQLGSGSGTNSTVLGALLLFGAQHILLG